MGKSRYLLPGPPASSLGPNRCRVVFEVPLLATPYLAVCRLAAQRVKHILEQEQQQQ